MSTRTDIPAKINETLSLVPRHFLIQYSEMKQLSIFDSGGEQDWAFSSLKLVIVR